MNIRRWYEAPEQELLRLEVEWFRHYLVSPPGLMLCLAQIGCILFANKLERYSDIGMDSFYRTLDSSPFSPLIVALARTIPSAFFFMIRLAPWLYLFNRRVVCRLREPMKDELLVLPLNGRMIWPAFLMSPMLMKSVVYIACFWIASISQVLIWPATFKSVLPYSEALYYPSLILPPLIILLGQLRLLISGMTLTVLVGRWIWKKPSAASMWIKAVLVYFLFIFIQGFFYSIANIILRIIWETTSLREHTPSNFQKIQALQAWGGAVIAFLNISFLLYLGLIALRTMRSERGWNNFLNRSTGEETQEKPALSYSCDSGESLE